MAQSLSPEPEALELRWSRSGGKRLFDLVGACLCLILGLPLMLLAAALIKCTSKGPVLFRQWRVGQHGRLFELLKFRTMVDRRSDAGPSLTRQGDPRIFPVGRFLRYWKLDELPQFFNVIRGDMSLVGPRPDMPEYLASLQEGQRKLVSLLRPGITGAASLQFRHEEALLAEVPPEQMAQFYTVCLLPAKVQIDIDYARGANVATDVEIIFRTAMSVLS
jgi:lipopolysaccharide/colanic/teichoic acid biosynthesis glycosyltransferase